MVLHIINFWGGGGGGGGGGVNFKKTKPYPNFLILGLGFFLVFFGLLLGNFWHHFNESRLLFL